MYLLSSDQEKCAKEAIQKFEQEGYLSIFEPCDCGNQIRHNNGGNYHDEIYLQRDRKEVFVKYETSCELVSEAEWQLVDDWKAVIKQNADWL